MDRSILEFRFIVNRLIYIITYTFIRLYERFEDSEEVIRTRIYRQYRGQNKKDNRTNNHLQNITQKTKERARRTSLKNMGEHRMECGDLNGSRYFYRGVFSVNSLISYLCLWIYLG